MLGARSGCVFGWGRGGAQGATVMYLLMIVVVVSFWEHTTMGCMQVCKYAGGTGGADWDCKLVSVSTC